MGTEPAQLRRQSAELMSCMDELRAVRQMIREVEGGIAQAIRAEETRYLLDALHQIYDDLSRQITQGEQLAEEIPAVGAQLRSETEILRTGLLEEDDGLF